VSEGVYQFLFVSRSLSLPLSSSATRLASVCSPARVVLSSATCFSSLCTSWMILSTRALRSCCCASSSSRKSFCVRHFSIITKKKKADETQSLNTVQQRRQEREPALPRWTAPSPVKWEEGRPTLGSRCSLPQSRSQACEAQRPSPRQWL